MALPRVAKTYRGGLQLFGELLCSPFRQAWIRNDSPKCVFIFRRVETAIKREVCDSTAKQILNDSCLGHNDIGILCIARKQIVMRDEPCAVFVDQDQPAELIRLGGLASPVKLRMRLEDAEQLI